MSLLSREVDAAGIDRDKFDQAARSQRVNMAEPGFSLGNAGSAAADHGCAVGRIDGDIDLRRIPSMMRA